MKTHSPRSQFTVAEIANAIGQYPKQVRRDLEGIKPSGVEIVQGKPADAYALSILPESYRQTIAAHAKANGYSDLNVFILLDKPMFQPLRRNGEPLKLADVREDEIERATKWRAALRPAFQLLQVNHPDWLARAIESCRLVFGTAYTSRHVRAKIAEARKRARSEKDYERVELYLPQYPATKAETLSEVEEFADVRMVLQEINRTEPEPEKVRAAWRLVFENLDRCIAAGQGERQAATALRDVLWNDAAFLFKTSDRDTMRRHFADKLKKWRASSETGLQDRRIVAIKARQESGALDGELTRQIEALGWFIPAARNFCLKSNRTHTSGSMPEAIRRTISLPALPVGWSKSEVARFLKSINLAEPPACPGDLRQQILDRQRAGQKLVPDSIARQIRSSAAVTKQHRNPTEAALDYLNAPGSMFFITDRETGERRPPRIGEVIEADDATINFPVCVPWKLGGDPCSDKYGVKVGRFQWLVAIDAASRCVTAWTYVMRPRSSYRAEDALALMRGHCVSHGIPGQWRFEQGVWKSNLVKNAVGSLGSDLHTVWSPHQKPYIEGLFNTLWTKLSVHFPGADVGRFRGESERANELLTACQNGHQDPRRHFPMLQTALAAFKEVIAEKNQTPVGSAVGRWVPAERWEGRANLFNNFPAATLAADQEYIFSPYQREWTVKGMLVGGNVPLIEGMSGVPFDFTADWLPRYHGVKVRVSFDPSSPECKAMVTLAQDFQGQKTGSVLGVATQINEVAGHVRMMLGWGDDPASLSRLARQRVAAAMRREVRAVAPQGAATYEHSEERDGVSKVAKLERNKPFEDKQTEKERSGARLGELLQEEPKRRSYGQEDLYADKHYVETAGEYGAPREWVEKAKSRIAAYEEQRPN